jgi:uncharacterized protein (TIGR00369 family)
VSTPITDEIRRIFNRAPFIADLGIQLDSLEEGACTTVLEIRHRHLQQDGFVHAGVLATMADHTAGAAATTLLREGQAVLTAEFKINLLRAARGERIICRSKVLKPGSTLTVVESEVFSVAAGQERLVSKATATMAVIAPTPGSGTGVA